MKLKMEKTAVLEALQKVQSVVNPRTTLPVLSNALWRAEGERLFLSATDLELSVQTSVPARVEREGGTTLPARRMASIIRELPSEEILVDVNEDDVASVQCAASFFKLMGIAQEDFPPLPRLEEERTYRLEQGVFLDMLQKTAYAASTDDTRLILNGVALSFQEDKLMVVATDGRRLALVEQEVEYPPEAEGEVIIPSKTVNELLRTLGGQGELVVRVSAKQAAFEFGDMLIISKLIEGTFPNFRQVIPAQSDERIAIEREALLDAVKRVALMATEQSCTVRLTFGKNRLIVSSETPEVGEARETLPVKYDGKEIAVAFNPDFLADPLRTIHSDEVFMELSDELSPGVLKCDVPFLYVLMPIRIT